MGVHDGDSITVLSPLKNQYKIRLEGIDAPEIGQEFSNKSKDHLSALVFGKTIIIFSTGLDKYGRTLGFVWVDGLNVNLRMIESGFAWQYTKYNQDIQFKAAQENAKAKRQGLWIAFLPMAPWEYRALKSSGDTAPPLAAIPAPADSQEVKSFEGSINSYWLNSSTGQRHNKSCRYFGRTKRGRYCGANEGDPCGICGG